MAEAAAEDADEEVLDDVDVAAADIGCGERTGDTDTVTCVVLAAPAFSLQSKASSTLERGLEQDDEPPELTALLPHSFFSLPDSMPESVGESNLR